MKGFQDVISWYNRHATEFSQRAGSATYDVMDEFQKLLPKGGKILDAGCGSGRDTNLFITSGFDTTGMDLSTGLIEQAKKNYPTGKFMVGDMRSLPFDKENFDGVWAQASLLHFETRKDVISSLNEFHRVLKASGVLFVSVKLQTGKDKTGLEYDKRFDEPRFFQYFTQDEMQDLVKNAGFEVLSSCVVQSLSRSEVKWIQIIAKKS